MKIKSIDFTSEMNLAVLNNHKSRTSRVIKPKYRDDEYGFVVLTDEGTGETSIVKMNEDEDPIDPYRFVYPKYQPGDILWIRETWRIGAWDESTQSIAVDYKVDDFCRLDWIHIDDKTRFDKYVRQTKEDAKKAELRPQSNGNYKWLPGYSPARWRRYMPAEVARTFLQVTNVQVHMIQDISDDDILREGILPGPDLRERFIKLWDGIYAKKGHGWDDNRFVWAYLFQKTQRPAEWPDIRR